MQQNLPNGITKVVRRADSLASGICQNPELASNFVNTLAPANWAKVCTNAGRVCRSLQTLSFRRVRSTHIRTFPSGFGTTTIPEHQSVGSWTHLTTPSLYIRSRSALTFGSIGIATLRGVVRANGLESAPSRIRYSTSNFPSPLNNLRNCILSLSFDTMVFTRRRRSKDSIAGRPSKGLLSHRTTKISSSTFRSPLEIVVLNCPFTGSTF